MAKKMYGANQDFMFRTPTAPYVGGALTEEELLNICRDEVFREKLLVASPSLLHMIDIYLKEAEVLSEKKKKEMFCSIEKYYRRSIERTTPFGLFAGVGSGSFAEKSRFDNKQQNFKKSVHPDAGWLWEYIAKLEQTYYKELSFKWNTVCIADGNRNLLLYTTTQDIEEISVRRTTVMDIVEEVCGEYTAFTEIVNRVQESYPEVETKVITLYVFDLIQKQILVSDLRPAISDKNPLDMLIKKVKDIDESIADALNHVKSMCEAYEQTAIGEGEQEYLQIVNSMKELHQSKYYLQVDTNIHGLEMTLDYSVKEQLEQLAEVLVILSTASQKQKEALNWYRDKFVEKYGLNRLVPLTEMLDTAIGIGAPIGYMTPKNDFFESSGSTVEIDKDVRNYFLREYERAIKGQTSIKIDIGELGKYLTFPNNAEAPTSFELYMKIRVEKGKLRLYMSGNGGASCAGKTFGRFALKNQNFARILTELNEKEKAVRGNVKTCEISYLPARLRNGNVMRCPSGRDMLLSAYVGADNSKEKLCQEDILIGVENERFYAVDRRTKERIVFGMNNMYNLLLQPNIYRFLLEIANEGEINCFDLPWKYIYQYFKHIPRIEMGDIVLAQEQWFVSANDLKLFDSGCKEEDFRQSFEQYRRENMLPEEVYLVEEDNRILLNLNSSISLRILWDEIKKKKGSSVLLEGKEDGEDLHYGEDSYATEIVVPIFRAVNSRNRHIPSGSSEAERNAHIALPYDNWLYFKLYCKHERETELIALELKAFAEKLHKEMGIEHFFMRYMDSKPHVRLRFYGSPQILHKATPDIMNWISELEKKQIIGEMSINQYEREIERYGGYHLISDAEALFRTDSVIVENILYKIRMRQTELSVEEVTILSVIKYLEAFYDDFSQWLDFCTAYYHTNQYLSEFREHKDRYLNLFDMENGWCGFGEAADRKELLEWLDKRKQVIGAYRVHMESENLPQAVKDDIVASVLHLHCNRMLGTNREDERKIMSFVESLLYAKKHLYKKRG